MHQRTHYVLIKRRFFVGLVFGVTLAIGSTKAQVVTADKAFVPRAAHEISEPVVIDSRRCVSDYPRASLAAEESGDVLLFVNVSATGEAKDVRLLRSSGFKNLDDSTINLFGQCMFRPLFVDGKPYAAPRLFVYHWRLSE